MSNELSRAIDADFTPAVCVYFSDGLRASCMDAATRFYEDIGCNGNTFGMDCYHFAVHQLKQALEFEPAGVTLAVGSTELEFRLQVGRFRVAVHRVGSSVNDPIQVCFPSSPNGPGRLARENAYQLSLDLNGTTSSIPTNVIVAYMSSPLRGLEAVYACVPLGLTDGGRVREWSFTKRLWAIAGEAHLPVTADIPPEVPIDEPPIRLRPSALVKE